DVRLAFRGRAGNRLRNGRAYGPGVVRAFPSCESRPRRVSAGLAVRGVVPVDRAHRRAHRGHTRPSARRTAGGCTMTKRSTVLVAAALLAACTPGERI